VSQILLFTVNSTTNNGSSTCYSNLGLYMWSAYFSSRTSLIFVREKISCQISMEWTN